MFSTLWALSSHKHILLSPTLILDGLTFLVSTFSRNVTPLAEIQYLLFSFLQAINIDVRDNVHKKFPW